MPATTIRKSTRTSPSTPKRGAISDPTRQVITRLTADRDVLRKAAHVLRAGWVNAAADRDALRAKCAKLTVANETRDTSDAQRENRYGRFLAIGAFIVGVLAGMQM
ncbi:MAG: hypothetical protein KDA32_09330 [Phycisphaerales bacterium]|nr:hypothetical protein [Phycisphaerales bacterium]